jgi:hypothetical protein
MTTGTIVMKVIIDAVFLMMCIIFAKLGFNDKEKWPTIVWELFFLIAMIGIWFI